MTHHLDNHLILGIHITNRAQHAHQVQQHLTDYGCYIKTRIGMHEADAEYCSPNGLIVIEMIDNAEKKDELKKKLSDIEGVEVQEMNFGHP